MIRFLSRFFGLIFLAAAFILVIYDGTKSIAASRFYFTTARALWELLSPGSLAAVRPLLSPYLNGVLWDPGMVTVLAWPAWSLLGCVGILLILLGRKKKPLIGYAR